MIWTFFPIHYCTQVIDTPSPHIKRFPLTRISTYSDFTFCTHWWGNSSFVETLVRIVPLTQFSRNTFFLGTKMPLSWGIGKTLLWVWGHPVMYKRSLVLRVGSTIAHSQFPSWGIVPLLVLLGTVHKRRRNFFWPFLIPSSLMSTEF